MTVRWSTLVADDTGTVDYSRLRSFTSVMLAWAAGLILCAIMTGLLTAPTDIVMIGVGALVLPLTGAKVSDVVAGMVERKAAKVEEKMEMKAEALREVHEPP